MHEVYHGIIRLYGIGFREWDEENIIDWTAQGFYQFILDNPEMFKEVLHNDQKRMGKLQYLLDL